MGTEPERHGLPRAVTIAVIALLVLLAAEGLMRVRASALPPPLKWATPDMDRKDFQMSDLEHQGGASVVFVGSSTIDSSIDPALLHDTLSRPAYNSGMRGGTVSMVSTWTERDVVPRLKPDTVVVGVASRELTANDPRQAGREKDFYDAPAVRYLVGNETFLQKTERQLESVSDLFKYRTWLRKPEYLKAVFGLGDAPSVTNSPVGDYISSEGQYTLFLHRPYSAKQFLIEEPKGTDISQQQVAVLHSLLGQLAAHVKHVVLVNMPVTTDYLKRQAPGGYEQFGRIMKAQADAIYATYVDAGVWDASLFADPVHVNADGSKKLTELLGKTLLRIGSR